MMRLFSHPRFLTIYSVSLTVVFILTTAINLGSRPFRVLGAEHHDDSAEFDQITVHRINVVEPDGTPRLIISDKSEFPGGFFKGKAITRPGRDPGLLFLNDEGTENGGLTFGGYRSSADGKFVSTGHLSFDEYEQDQTLSMDTEQYGDQRRTRYQINDNQGETLMTPEVLDAFGRIGAIPDGPERQKARVALKDKYRMGLVERASLARDADKSVALRLRDPDGHIRILLRVSSDGTPSLQSLDAAGKVVHEWPETNVAPGAK
jgi:hypothetical protein